MASCCVDSLLTNRQLSLEVREPRHISAGNQLWQPPPEVFGSLAIVWISLGTCIASNRLNGETNLGRLATCAPVPAQLDWVVVIGHEAVPRVLAVDSGWSKKPSERLEETQKIVLR